MLAGCGDNLLGDDRLGGDTTIDDRTDGAFLHPAANLGPDDRATFQAGTGPFDFLWEIPKLGPSFNNDACSGCHGSNGRGRSQIGAMGARIDINGAQSEALVRVSLTSGTPADPGGDVPVPGFGLQLRDHSTTGLPPVTVRLTWAEMPVAYADGSEVMLRHPVLDIRQPDGTSLPAGTLTSYRTAPPMIGLGLLEAVPEDDIVALEDPDDRNNDGISGRSNRVWNPMTHQTELGRFGWKANTVNLTLQSAGAAANDMGLSNRVFPPSDGSPLDFADLQLEQMTFMVRTIAVPAAAPRSSAAYRGEALFEQFACSSCHVPTLVTGDADIPQLAHQLIHPYTDLLLHDLGDALADERPDFRANEIEWRTPPLWGIGLARVVRAEVDFLHDGRARSLEEAIMWHGGEAMAAREGFRNASARDRAALIEFLNRL